jgi:hypothetical protein
MATIKSHIEDFYSGWTDKNLKQFTNTLLFLYFHLRGAGGNIKVLGSCRPSIKRSQTTKFKAGKRARCHLSTLSLLDDDGDGISAVGKRGIKARTPTTHYYYCSISTRSFSIRENTARTFRAASAIAVIAARSVVAIICMDCFEENVIIREST